MAFASTGRASAPEVAPAQSPYQPCLPFDQDDLRLLIDLGDDTGSTTARRMLMFGIAVHLTDNNVSIEAAAQLVGVAQTDIEDIVAHRSRLDEWDLVLAARALGIRVHIVGSYAGERA